MRSLYVSFLFIFLALAGFDGHSCRASEPAQTERILIEADRMESRQNENKITFFGHVEAKQGDLLINADTMAIHYKDQAQKGDTGKDASQNIEKLVARGNVILTRQDWNASGDAIDYFATERKIILTGNTKVFRNNNLISGEKIVLYLDEGKSIVESGPGKNGRVTAIIHPEEVQSKNGKPDAKKKK